MADESIGTARMEIEVDISQFQATIDTAKNRVAGMSSEFQNAYTKMSDAEKKSTLRLLDKVNALNLTKEQLLVYTAALKTNGVVLDELTKKIATNAAAQTDSAEKYVMSAKAQAAAMRGVPAQITDIVTSLQGGQQPLTVLFQQGGQLRDMFGGIVPAASALGKSVLGLINPFTIAAAGLGLLVYAFESGSEEMKNYNRTLLLSGDAVGVTASQLNDMAARMGRVTGSQHEAADALVKFASNSKAAGDSIERFSSLAIKMEKTTGQSVDATVKQFEELGRSPVDASLKLNESTNFLTASLFQQIKALDEQGKTADASKVAQSAYADAMESRLPKLADNLGSLERAWKGVSSTAKEAWDAILGVGRADSTDQKIADVKARLAELNGGGARGTAAAARHGQGSTSPTSGGTAADVRRGNTKAALEASLAQLEATKKQEVADAAAAKARNDYTNATNDFIADTDKYVSAQDRARQARDKVLNEFARLSPDQQKDNFYIKKRDNSLAEINKAGFGSMSKAGLDGDIKAIKDANDSLVNIYSNSEKVLEESHKNGLMSDADYYEAKREFVELNEHAQEDALRKQIARYQQEKLSGADAIANQNKIKDAQAQIAKLREDAAGKTSILNAQEVNNQNKLKASYLATQQAAQSYFDTQERQQQRALDSMGKGQNQKNFDAGINQIEDKYQQQRLALESQRALLEAQTDESGKNNLFTADERKKYEDRLALIKLFQQKSIDSYRDYYNQLMAKQGDWQLGFKEGLQDYADASRNVFEQMKTTVANAFKGSEDSLVKFVTTGKLSFGDLVTSIENDMARMAVRQGITGPLASLLSGVFGNNLGSSTALLGSAGSGATPFGVSPGNTFGTLGSGFFGMGAGHANGGPTSANGLYPVNERGPEVLTVSGKDYLMMGSKSGMVTSHERSMSQMSAGMVSRKSTPVTVNLMNAPAGTTATATSKQDGSGGLSVDILFNQVQNRIASDVSKGEGALHKSMMNRFALKPQVRR